MARGRNVNDEKGSSGRSSGGPKGYEGNDGMPESRSGTNGGLVAGAESFGVGGEFKKTYHDEAGTGEAPRKHGKGGSHEGDAEPYVPTGDLQSVNGVDFGRMSHIRSHGGVSIPNEGGPDKARGEPVGGPDGTMAGQNPRR